MVLLYSPFTTPRLKYIASFIFSERLGLPVRITQSPDELEDFDGVRINYSRNEISVNCIHILPSGFLQEQSIRSFIPEYRRDGNRHLLFPVSSGDLSFDLLSASFYLLSRYEEYLPHKKDLFGRFAHEESLAWKLGILQQPLIDQWVIELSQKLKQRFPNVPSRTPEFSFRPTYDIDNAYAYNHKSFRRKLGGWLRSPSLNRLRVLMGTMPDPYDAYRFMDELHTRFDLSPLYFFLAAKEIGGYDRNIDRGPALSELISNHARKYRVGLHPGWKSGDSEAVLQEEKHYLETVAGKEIRHSRQHFIRFNLPDGYRRLIDIGITDDYSMGYGSINGFRASTGASFHWYDLEKESSTGLTIHPFCFMDANSFYEQRLSPDAALDELMQYHRVCKEAGTTLTTIWHNHFLGTAPQFAGWRETYEAFLNQSLRH